MRGVLATFLRACRLCLRSHSLQVTEAVLAHDIEDAWRLQDGTLGCIDAALLEGLPATGAGLFGEATVARAGQLGGCPALSLLLCFRQVGAARCQLARAAGEACACWPPRARRVRLDTRGI